MRQVISKNNIIFISVILLIFIFLIIMNKNKKEVSDNLNLVNKNINDVCPAPMEKAKIATCPTFYEDIKKLDQEKYEFIFTNSSAESLSLLNKGSVDLVLAGRTLMPEEEKFNHKIIEKADNYYSFLSNKSESIYVNNFNLYNFYTDLDLDKVKENLNIKNINQVENIYNYLNNGIIVTSWENTDFNKANIVHVLNDDNSRLKISRIPIVYHKSNCDQAIITEIENLINNK